MGKCVGFDSGVFDAGNVQSISFERNARRRGLCVRLKAMSFLLISRHLRGKTRSKQDKLKKLTDISHAFSRITLNFSPLRYGGFEHCEGLFVDDYFRCIALHCKVSQEKTCLNLKLFSEKNLTFNSVKVYI